MRIYSRKVLKRFWSKHRDSEKYLRTWYETALKASWSSPYDIKKRYASASVLKGNRIVFNIKGNTYRLVVKFNYEKQWGFIKFIGTHSEYDRINSNTI